MKIMLCLFLFLLPFLALSTCRGDDDGYYLPPRLARVWAPLPEECPPNYLRVDDYSCWDVFRPTAAPYPTPTGTLIYFPTVTPVPPPAD